MKSILPYQWVKQTKENRQKVAVAFGLKRTGGFVIENNTVVCDGYTAKDLLPLTDEVMRKFLGLDANDTQGIETLFISVIQKLNEPSKKNTSREKGKTDSKAEVGAETEA